jgi:hypothetical protein
MAAAKRVRPAAAARAEAAAEDAKARRLERGADLFGALDDDVHRHILSFLRGSEVALLQRVSKLWRRVSDSASLWADLLRSEFSHSTLPELPHHLPFREAPALAAPDEFNFKSRYRDNHVLSTLKGARWRRVSGISAREAHCAVGFEVQGVDGRYVPVLLIVGGWARGPELAVYALNLDVASRGPCGWIELPLTRDSAAPRGLLCSARVRFNGGVRDRFSLASAQ